MKKVMSNRRSVCRSGTKMRGHYLGVEALEERCVPTTLLWTGQGAGANWSLPANWLNPVGNKVAPKNGDTAVFDPAKMVGAVNGANSNGTDNISGLKLSAITIGSKYTSTISLSASLIVGQTTVNGQASKAVSTMAGGTMTGRTFTIWTGATLN
jgi:hypothetical protein